MTKSVGTVAKQHQGEIAVFATGFFLGWFTHFTYVNVRCSEVLNGTRPMTMLHRPCFL